METGLLIYDSDPKCDLAEKVKRAARRYQQKFSTMPDICYVHPDAFSHYVCQKKLPDGAVKVGTVTVEPLQTTLVNHFWIGIEQEKDVAES